MARTPPTPTAPPVKLWQPKHADKAADGRDLAGPSGDRVSWIGAPRTSHVHSFAFVDALDPAMRRHGTLSQVRIRFKGGGSRAAKKRAGATGYGTKGKGFAAASGGTEYAYTFAQHKEAERWWKRLISHPHPGELVPLIHDACQSYKRTV